MAASADFGDAVTAITARHKVFARLQNALSSPEPPPFDRAAYRCSYERYRDESGRPPARAGGLWESLVLGRASYARRRRATPASVTRISIQPPSRTAAIALAFSSPPPMPTTSGIRLIWAEVMVSPCSSSLLGTSRP